MIVQNIGREGKANMTFTIPKDDALKAEGVVDRVFQDIGGRLSRSTDIANCPSSASACGAIPVLPLPSSQPWPLPESIFS